MRCSVEPVQELYFFLWIALEANGRRRCASARCLVVIVMVPRGSICASACVLLLVAGQVRSVVGKVGIHRPYFAASGPLSLHESQAAYRELSEATRKYLRDMSLPESLFEAMLRVAPERVRWLSEDELLIYGLDGENPAYAEMRDSQNATLLGVTKTVFLQRRASISPKCDQARAHFIGRSDWASSGQKPTDRQRAEASSAAKQYKQCQDEVMRGER